MARRRALLFGRGSGGVLLPLYALFVSLWVTGFLESWKSAEATMAMRWGMSDFKTYEQNRPQFVGRESQSAARPGSLRAHNACRALLGSTNRGVDKKSVNRAPTVSRVD